MALARRWLSGAIVAGRQTRRMRRDGRKEPRWQPGAGARLPVRQRIVGETADFDVIAVQIVHMDAVGGGIAHVRDPIDFSSSRTLT
jgi:hypothetical protein